MNTIKIIDDAKTPTSKLLSKCKDKFDIYSYWNNEELDSNFPPPKEPTERYFKDVIEADEEHKNKSANDLEKEGIQGITIRERLIMELEYFEKTGGHLDADNITLCSGSRDSDGGVPRVDWRSGDRKVCVNWVGLSDSYSDLRTRAVVSNPLSSNLESLTPKLPQELEINGVKYRKVV